MQLLYTARAANANTFAENSMKNSNPLQSYAIWK